MGGSRGPGPGELAAIDWLAGLLPTPEGDLAGVGDDAAVVEVAGATLLFATDLVAESHHFDRRLSSLADVGWKVLAVNVSDLAAMGGEALRAVVGVAGAKAAELEELYAGLLEASEHYRCPIVGGDLVSAGSLVVSVALLGTVGAARPVLRSGARPGDQIFCTGSLGRSAAGLRLLREDPGATGPLVDAHRRPTARVGEGRAAVLAGATAMIDLSDGIGLDLHRLADASGVGFVLDELPVAAGASEEEALAGGEDYELCFTAPDAALVRSRFAADGLAEPLLIGVIAEERSRRELRGSALPRRGHEHRLA